jgi:histidinol-phosphatase
MPTDGADPGQPTDLSGMLALGRELADRADLVTMEHFRSRRLVVERKPDRSEVTIADRNTEMVIEERLRVVVPEHGLLGEEFGVRGGPGAYRWIVDPIDGTANYVRGVPIWATLIALQHHEQIVLGVVSAPALGMRWWAARGHGAFRDGTPLRVSAVAELSDAYISFSDGHWADAAARNRLGDVIAQCDRQRSLGDFWQHMLVAEGAVDVAVEPIVSLWDLAALQVIVEEAGGTFTDLNGHARADGGSALSTNGLLHERVLRTLSAPA